MVKSRALAILLAAAALVMMPSHLPSCGPWFPQAVFHEQSQPQYTEADLLAGRLGVIQPSFWRKYLCYAYRHLSGKPLTAADLQTPASPPVDGARMWLDARAEVSGAASPRWLQTSRQAQQYVYFENCLPDALAQASATLRDRVRRFGATHEGVKSWLPAQDIVFQNCDEGKSIPPDAEAGLPALLKADRAYQQAAALFYSQSYDESRSKFLAIGRDASSPWRAMGPYLAARALIRKSTVMSAEGEVNRGLLLDAARELKEIMSDPGQEQMHEAAGRMLGYVTVRLEPLEALRRISQELMTQTASGQSLIDFQYLMDQYAANWEEARQAGELPEWISTFQRSGPEALQYSLDRYRAGRGAPWLVAAMSKLDGRHPEARRVMEEASGVGPESTTS